MNTLLHVPSLLIAAAVTGACVSVSHLLIWRAVRRETSVLLWGIGYGLATLAMATVGLRDSLPLVLSIIVGNTLLLLSLGFIWCGYRRFIGKISRWDPLVTSLGGAFWLVFACYQPLFGDINLRVEAVSLVQLAYLLAIACDLVAHWRREPLPALRLTVAVIVLQQALLAIRIVYLMMSPVDPATVNIPSTLPIALSLIGSTGFIVFFGLLQLALVGQRSERRFRIAAETDGLTGLANRRRFLDEILSHLANSADRGALILFDLDHFKRINDTYGHLMGDRALTEFATTLSKATPEQGIAARIGGEEFALFLPDASAPIATDLAEQIRGLTQSFELETPRGGLRITVSGGVAGVAETGSSYEALHSAADVALYRAKSDGRNRIAIHRLEPPKPLLAIARPHERRAGQPASAAI